MSNCSISHDVALTEALRKDPEFAFAYLDDVLLDGDKEECLLALRRVTEAQGGIAQLAKKTKLNEKTLHRTLSREGNPTLTSLLAIFRALGLGLAVRPQPMRREAS